MKKTKSLLDTNPYLKKPGLRKRMIAQAVKSSFAVEGINISMPRTMKSRKKKRRPTGRKNTS